MLCHQGFEEAEAKASRICVDCSYQFCSSHPKHDEWRGREGLLPKVFRFQPQVPEFKPEPQVSVPAKPQPQVPVPFKFVVTPQVPRGGYKRGRMFRDIQTSNLMHQVVRTMIDAARIMFEGEELKGWHVDSKMGVWATRCSYTKKDIQFGEGSALLHYEGVSRDTVMKEMIRYGWERTPENGWTMIVIHEVAHAVVHKLYTTRIAPHGREFHQTLRGLRLKYFDRLRPMFNGLLTQKVAADKF